MNELKNNKIANNDFFRAIKNALRYSSYIDKGFITFYEDEKDVTVEIIKKKKPDGSDLVVVDKVYYGRKNNKMKFSKKEKRESTSRS